MQHLLLNFEDKIHKAQNVLLKGFSKSIIVLLIDHALGEESIDNYSDAINDFCGRDFMKRVDGGYLVDFCLKNLDLNYKSTLFGVLIKCFEEIVRFHDLEGVFDRVFGIGVYSGVYKEVIDKLKMVLIITLTCWLINFRH